jgi:hypothetical protein
VPLNDAVTDGQAQTGAVHSFSRIEGLEDALAHLFADAYPSGAPLNYERLWRADFGRELQRASQMR